MFSKLCFERSTCLTDIQFGLIITFKFVYTCGCFSLLGIVCDFVCEVSLECAVCSVCYVVFEFF